MPEGLLQISASDPLDEIAEDLGSRFFVILKAYFDESFSESHPVMAMGGIVCDRSQVRKLNRKWRNVLKDFDIDSFHMTDCANGAPPYDAMLLGRRDRLARKLIAAIRSHAEFQLALSVNIEDYIECARRISLETGINWLFAFGGPYTFLAQMCMICVGDWCAVKASEETVTYVLEQGNPFQTEAGKALDLIHTDKTISQKYRYYTHVFAPKKGMGGVRLLQAADILAWEWMRDRTEQIEKVRERPRRLSLTYLIKNRLFKVEHWREQELMARFRQSADYNFQRQGRERWKPYMASEFEDLSTLIRSRKSLPVFP